MSNEPESDPANDAPPLPTKAKKRTTRKTAKASADVEPTKPARKRAAPKSTRASAEINEQSKPKTRKAATSVDEPAFGEPQPAATGQAPQPEPAPSTNAETSEARATKKFGRVPGGGPLVPRSEEIESTASPATEEPASIATPSSEVPADPTQGGRNQRNNKRRRDKRKRRGDRRGEAVETEEPRASVPLLGPKIEADGLLEIAPKGFGFLRIPGKNYEQARDDIFVSPELIRRHGLRVGHWVHGLYQESQRGPQLVEINHINGLTPEESGKLPHFDELKAINPNKRISFETTAERFTTRIVDIMAPVGRGQRGLIVSPPRSGKTTLLLHMAEAIREKYEDTMHLMILLVDERPEEVTEFRRALPGAEIYASSNDEQARNHCRIAELAIERAKRLVEAGKDVFLLMDSITRLARAYNNSMGGGNQRKRGTGSGGITIGALEVPRRLFAAARNTRGGGSLTILATALIQTNSRADEAIFMEFKGTGNMELVLDRKIAENYIYPAADIFKSGTRREELLLAEHMLHKIHLIRRGLSGHKPVEAMERLLFFLKKFPNNPQMLLEIKG